MTNPRPSAWSALGLTLRGLLWAALLPGFFAGYVPWRYFGLGSVTLRANDVVQWLGLAATSCGVVLLAACIR